MLCALAACSFQGGIEPGFQCGEDGWCPAGQVCESGFCVADPAAADGGPDADRGDGGVPAARCGTLSVLRDDFGDGVAAPDFYPWNDVGASVSETGGHVVIDVPAGSSGGWAGYTSMFRYDFTGAAWEAKVSEVGGHYTTLEVRDLAGARMQMLVEDGTLLAGVLDVPGEGVRATLPYAPDAHAYWRMREEAGVAYWETSPDRALWSRLHSEPLPISPDHVLGIVSGGGQLASASQIRFDDVNLETPAALGLCPAVDLVDDFASTTLAPEWEAWEDTACSVSVAGGNLVLAFPDGDPDQWCGIGSSHLYDFRDSQIVIDAAAVPGLPSLVTYLQVTQPGDGFTHLQIARDDDSMLSVTQRVAGTFESGTTRTYSPVNHRYWRIRSAGDRVYFETSPDLSTWTIHADDVARFDLSQVWLVVAAGSYDVSPGEPIVVPVAAVNP